MITLERFIETPSRFPAPVPERLRTAFYHLSRSEEPTAFSALVGLTLKQTLEDQSFREAALAFWPRSEAEISLQSLELFGLMDPENGNVKRLLAALVAEEKWRPLEDFTALIVKRSLRHVKLRARLLDAWGPTEERVALLLETIATGEAEVDGGDGSLQVMFGFRWVRSHALRGLCLADQMGFVHRVATEDPCILAGLAVRAGLEVAADLDRLAEAERQDRSWAHPKEILVDRGFVDSISMLRLAEIRAEESAVYGRVLDRLRDAAGAECGDPRQAN